MFRTMIDKRALFWAGLILIALPIAACNTVKGAGKDIEKIGETVGEGADAVGDKLGEIGD